MQRFLKNCFGIFLSLAALCAVGGSLVTAVGMHILPSLGQLPGMAGYRTSFWATLFCLLLFAALLFVFYKTYAARPNVWLWGAVAVGVFLRLFCVFFLHQAPQSDFLTYHETAAALAAGNYVSSRYVSIFPHVLGYADVLSVFYRIFGTSPLVAQLLNIVCDMGCMALLFSMGSRLYGKQAGTLALLLFAVYPSAVLYCTFVCTEKLFTVLLLLFCDVLLKTEKRPWLFACLAGACIGAANRIRPCGMLALIAVFLYLFVGGRKQVRYFLPLLLVYMTVSLAGNAAISTQNQTPVAQGAVGWNAYVGANTTSYGRWNEEDAALFGQLSEDTRKSPQEVQQFFAQKAWQRVRENGLFGNLRLAAVKFAAMWGTDFSAYDYIGGFAYQPIAQGAQAAFYPLLLCLAYLAFRQGRHRQISIFAILILGFAAQHLIAEVMGRYAYTPNVLFCLIAAAFVPWEKTEKRKIPDR